MRKLFSIILLLSTILLTSCSDDDWAYYNSASYEISTKINGNVFIISEVESEIFDIANDYEEELELKQVDYHFTSDEIGYAKFCFQGEYTKSGTGYTIQVDVFIDFAQSKAYQVNFVEGHSKRVSYTVGEVVNKSQNAFEIYTSHKPAKNITVDDVEVRFFRDEITLFYNNGREMVERIEISTTD